MAGPLHREVASVRMRSLLERSMNPVCFASSPRFGRALLKVGVPRRELFTGIQASAAVMITTGKVEVLERGDSGYLLAVVPGISERIVIPVPLARTLLCWLVPGMDLLERQTWLAGRLNGSSRISRRPEDACDRR